jgi:predicted DNA-binding transcriptional regulator AlpA
MTPRKRKAPDVWLTGPEVAARLGIDPATWRGYVNRGQAPQPDDPDEGVAAGNRRTPRWLSSTIDAVEAKRKISPMARSAAAKREAS